MFFKKKLKGNHYKIPTEIWTHNQRISSLRSNPLCYAVR